MRTAIVMTVVVAACGTGERECFDVPVEVARVVPDDETPNLCEPRTSLTGGARPVEMQGTQLQGCEEQGSGSGIRLSDLNGAAIRWRDAPVQLVEGALASRGEPLAPSTEPLEVRTATGDALALTVTAVEQRGGVTLYALASAGKPVCAGDELGLFVPGAWDARGGAVARPGTLTFACESGVITKCVRWGYDPGSVGADVHQACTRLARADYCGDGVSWTRNGTLVNIYDSLGIQTSSPSADLTFEAAWGPSGAVCRHEPRYTVRDADGQPVQPWCWASLPACSSFEQARSFGAIMAVDSAHAPLETCER